MAKKTKTLYDKTYWSHKGKYEKLNDKLFKLLPKFGEVENADDNPQLEKFRVASNCYYDLYNNGLCNRADEFEQVFGFRPEIDGDLTAEVINQTEREMNKIILRAAKEQGLKVRASATRKSD